MTDRDQDLKKEIKELNNRINELEKILSNLIQPLRNAGDTTSKYIRLIGLMMEHGGLTPEIVLKDVKDPISKEIVRVLIEKTEGQNISQITELVRNKRGTASRRIIRERLKELEEKDIIYKRRGKINVYQLSEKVIKKWSQLLGFNI